MAKAAANAEGYDEAHDVSALYNVPPGTLTAGQLDVLAQSGENWDAVRQATYNTLINNNSGVYPDLAASKEVTKLDSLEPRNTQFAAANQKALGEADQQWSNEGITYAKLHPIIAAYNNVLQTTKAVNQYLNNPHLPHNRAIVSTLLGSEQDAEGKLNAAIEASLTDAANQAGSDPKARSQAITTRAAYIKIAGPQDAAFQTAVDNANYDLQVVKPAQSVADAYAKGGALAAANQLAAVTSAPGNAYYASQIISQSQGTINLIAKGLGDLAAGKPQQPGQYAPFPIEASPQFYQIYGDLSDAVGAANPYTYNTVETGTLTPYGRQAAQIVGDAIAANAPTGSQTGLYNTAYQDGLYGIVANVTMPTDGGALAMATAVALEQRGNSQLASSVMGGLKAGFNALNSQTNDDVQAFGTTMADLGTLRTIFGPFMTSKGSSSQLVKATNGYLTAPANQGVRTQADAELATIGQDGDSVATAMTAWNTFRGQLNGVAGFEDLSKAVNALTGTNASTNFAVTQSKVVSDAIATALTGLPAQATGLGSVAEGFLASPGWRLVRANRRFFNNLLKVTEGKNFTAFYAVGLLTNIGNAVAHGGYPVSSPLNVATSAYNFLGLKFAGETLAGLAKSRIASTLASELGISTDQLSTLAGATGRGLSAAQLSKLAGDNGIDIPPNLVKLSGLPDLAWFKGVNVAFFGSDGVADVLMGLQNFADGDPVDGAFNAGAGVGSFTNAAKAQIGDLLFDGDADVAGLVGAAITLFSVAGLLTYDGIKDVEATNAFRASGAIFLEKGLGIKPGVASALMQPAGASSLPTVFAELQALAKANNITPGQVLLDLNRLPVPEVANFLNIVSNVATGKLVQPRGGYVQLSQEQGVQYLNTIANGIFGPNPVR